MRAVVAFLALTALFSLALAQQRDPFHGFYWGACHQYGSGTAKTFLALVNSAYMMRTQLYANDPQCANGYDVAYDHFGVMNVGVGQVTNTVGATNIDFGMENRIAKPLNAAGAAMMNQACNTNVFAPNQITDMSTMNCPSLNVQPFSACPMRFSIAKLTGDALQLAMGQCAVAQRATDFTNGFTLPRIDNFPQLEGLWQGTCFTDSSASPVQSIGTEFQVFGGIMYLSAVYIYESANCDPSTLGMKVTHGGMINVYQPETNAPAGSFDMEMHRRSHTWFIVSSTMLQRVNQQAAPCGLSFQQNVLTDVSNMTCAPVHLLSARDCPTFYDILALNNGQLYFGQWPQLQTALCDPANRPTQLATTGAVNIIPQPGFTSNTGAVVVLVLLILGLVFGLAWIVFRHRGQTGSVLRNLCCGSSASYTETA